MEDYQLIELLRNNPSSGLLLAMKQYGGLARYILTQILGEDHKEDVEECLSDVFCELWKSIDRYDSSKGSLKNYIIGIARYKGIRLYKKICKDQKHLIPIEENNLEMNLDLTHEVSQKINVKILNETLLELGEPDREIFIRRYFLFEKVKDIAVFLKLEPKTVENKLFRGKAKLKKALLERGITL